MRANTTLLYSALIALTTACTPQYMRHNHDTREETVRILQQPYKGRQGGLIIPLERLQTAGSSNQSQSPVDYIITRDRLLDQISTQQDSTQQ